MAIDFDDRNNLFDKQELRQAGFGIEATGFGLCANVLYIKNRPAVAFSYMDEGLAGFSVAKYFRKRGVATQFLRELLEENGGRLDVVDPNEAMLHVLKKLGRVSQPNGAGVVTVEKYRPSLMEEPSIKL